MTLIVDELFDGVTFPQNFRINRSIQVPHIRPWVYKHGALQSGELVLQIYQGSTMLKEATIDYTKINEEITGTFAHGRIRFDLEPLQLNHDRKADYTEYQMRLFMRNYTDNSNAFVGAVRQYERKIYELYGNDVTNNEAPNDMVEPLGFELFEYTY